MPNTLKTQTKQTNKKKRRQNGFLKKKREKKNLLKTDLTRNRNPK